MNIPSQITFVKIIDRTWRLSTTLTYFYLFSNLENVLQKVKDRFPTMTIARKDGGRNTDFSVVYNLTFKTDGDEAEFLMYFNAGEFGEIEIE